jgi:hypothetical protein
MTVLLNNRTFIPRRWTLTRQTSDQLYLMPGALAAMDRPAAACVLKYIGRAACRQELPRAVDFSASGFTTLIGAPASYAMIWSKMSAN